MEKERIFSERGDHRWGDLVIGYIILVPPSDSRFYRFFKVGRDKGVDECTLKP